MGKVIVEEKKLNSLVKKAVIEALQNFLGDPDAGLELRPEVVKRLRKSIRSKETGRVKDLEEVLKKYGA